MSQGFEFEKNRQAINDLVIPREDFVQEGSNLVWRSDDRSVGNFSSIQGVVNFSEMIPDGRPESGNIDLAFELYASLETGHQNLISRNTIVSQVEPQYTINGDGGTPTRFLISDPKALELNPESERFSSDGRTGTSRDTKHLGEFVQLVITVKPIQNSGAEFESITISADGLFY